MARHKDIEWSLPSGQLQNWEQVRVAVLMDIRDELREIRLVLKCQNFQEIPTVLRGIRRKLPAQAKHKTGGS